MESTGSSFFGLPQYQNVSHASEQRQKHSPVSPVGIVIVLGFTIGMVVCMYVLIKKHRRGHSRGLKTKAESIKESLLGPLNNEKVTPLDGKRLVSSISFNFESLRWVPKHIEFTLAQLSVATNKFAEANVLGEGGFGKVYMGVLPLPPYSRIAIKVLTQGSTQGLKEFITEVEVLSRLDHEHLVRLLGHCVTEEERILVYRHVANGSLSSHLHRGESKGPGLTWETRVKIALGAALGIHHLHKQHPRILHRDIKAANILLTRKYNAKVCDFGFAKQVGATPLHPNTLSQSLRANCCTPSRSCAMGTLGYVAPETFAAGDFSAASDVYSFGVVLLELLSGRKPVDSTRPDREKSLVGLARIVSNEGNIASLLDPSMPESSGAPKELVLQFAQLAMACVEVELGARPSMVEVVEKLQDIQAEHNARQDCTIIDLHETASGSEQGSSQACSTSSSEDNSDVFYELTSSNFASPCPDFAVNEAGVDEEEEVQSNLSSMEEGKRPSSASWLASTKPSNSATFSSRNMRG